MPLPVLREEPHPVNIVDAVEVGITVVSGRGSQVSCPATPISVRGGGMLGAIFLLRSCFSTLLLLIRLLSSINIHATSPNIIKPQAAAPTPISGFLYVGEDKLPAPFDFRPSPPPAVMVNVITVVGLVVVGLVVIRAVVVCTVMVCAVVDSVVVVCAVVLTEVVCGTIVVGVVCAIVLVGSAHVVGPRPLSLLRAIDKLGPANRRLPSISWTMK
jgi:hypothetical protein